MKKQLKVKRIVGKKIFRPDAHQVLEFVNNNDVDIISIIDDGSVYEIFYYEKK